jgi:Tol biopolymer transport system component
VVLAAGRGISHVRPNWSPDGTALVFRSNIEGPGIYTIRIDGTGLTKVVGLNGGISEPAWSPVPAADGEYKIAFSDRPRNEDGSLAPNADIFLVNPDGGGLQNLTSTPLVYEANPTWAPSSTQLAVWDVGEENVVHNDILVLDIGLGTDGLEVTAELNLTSEADVPGGLLNDAQLRLPAWAKTQDKILVDAREAGLWIIDLADPANPTNLKQAPATRASWSSDDTRIVYDEGTFGLFVLPTDGTGSPSAIVSNGYLADWRR